MFFSNVLYRVFTNSCWHWKKYRKWMLQHSEMTFHSLKNSSFQFSIFFCVQSHSTSSDMTADSESHVARRTKCSITSCLLLTSSNIMLAELRARHCYYFFEDLLSRSIDRTTIVEKRKSCEIVKVREDTNSCISSIFIF